MTIHARVAEVTERIVARSRDTRTRYLGRLDAAAEQARTPRARLGCANQAHAFAAAPAADKAKLALGKVPNLGIVTAYNDMLSAHQPYETYPELIRRAARAAGATAQVAGGVPAMCDGVTQGEAGMELSLFSRRRDRAGHRRRAVAPDVRRRHLSRHLRQDRARAGHGRAGVRPPAGRVRARRPDDDRDFQYREIADPPALCRAQGGARRTAQVGNGRLSRPRHLHLLRHGQHQPDADGDHGPAPAGRGLHQSGHASCATRSPQEAARRVLSLTASGNTATCRSAACWTSACSSTGSSGCMRPAARPNHTIHLIAMANAAGVTLTWDDFSELAEVTPLLARVYPERQGRREPFPRRGRDGLPDPRADLDGGMLHGDVATVCRRPAQPTRPSPSWSRTAASIWRDIPARKARRHRHPCAGWLAPFDYDRRSARPATASWASAVIKLIRRP